MKRRWHIQTRILVTLIGLTVAILLAVGAAFNLSIRSYVRSRVAAQLSTVSENASFERREGQRPEHGEKLTDQPPDRVIGTTGSAVVLNENGNLVAILRGDEKAGKAISSYFSEHPLNENAKYTNVSTDDSKYVVSVTTDPMQNGNFLVSYVDVTSITAFTRQVNLVLLSVICAAILISVVLSRSFARSFAQPVRELSNFAGEIGEGKFDNRELSFNDVEFGQLASSMNRMASALREANRKQETFFQNVSHELRTPLTSIRGNAEGIACGVIEPETAAKVILTESDKLGGMVEDILYLSRIGRSVPETAPEPIDIRELLSLCVSEQHAEADKRGVAFIFDFDDEPVLLPIREQDAQRLFGNLISNAIRYAHSEIRLSCHTAADAVTVSVADDGDGISEEDLPHVFERFYKGKGGKHGIGLSIAQSVAKACSGVLSVKNDGGAVFEASFPKEKQ
ncbi:MAG: HAMP domain-containing histidine kinase [Oscillospiraceae bacterium]|nr:HAMP domain-containing histidine kinase [Oscillospiraceae bacterium]